MSLKHAKKTRYSQKFINLKRYELPQIKENKKRLQIVSQLLVLFGRFQEAHRKYLLEKEYNKNYREINREKIRNYASQYARIKRSKLKESLKKSE